MGEPFFKKSSWTLWGRAMGREPNRELTEKDAVSFLLSFSKAFYDIFQLDKDRDIFWRIIKWFWINDFKTVQFKALHDAVTKSLFRPVSQNRVKARVADLAGADRRLVTLENTAKIKANTGIKPTDRLREYLPRYLEEFCKINPTLFDSQNRFSKLQRAEKAIRVIDDFLALYVSRNYRSIVTNIAAYAAKENRKNVEHIVARFKDNHSGCYTILHVLLKRAVDANYRESPGLSKPKLAYEISQYTFLPQEHFDSALMVLCDEAHVIRKEPHGSNYLYDLNPSFELQSRIYLKEMIAAHDSFLQTFMREIR